MKERKDMKRAVDKSWAMYNSYNPDVWIRKGFYNTTGGYVVVHRKRMATACKSNNEVEKFKIEFAMADVSARNGYRIEMLDENPHKRTYDVNINGIPADLKVSNSEKNILNSAKKAVRKQGARFVLFQFKKKTDSLQGELSRLRQNGYKVLYFFSGENKVYIL